jgi:hypothetical protein
VRSVAHLGLPADLRWEGKANCRLWSAAHPSIRSHRVSREESRIQSGDDWRRREMTRAENANTVPLERRNARRGGRSTRDANATYGPPELCAWQVEQLGSSKGIFWLQTTSKAFSRKLAKRRDTRCVEVIGYNHFRRTYEMRGSWRKVKRLIDRYILSAADSILPVNLLQNASRLGRKVNTDNLRIPVGLVTADSVSGTAKIRRNTVGYATSCQSKRKRQPTSRQSSSRIAR